MSENDNSEEDQPELEGESEDVELQSRVDKLVENVKEKIAGDSFGDDLLSDSQFDGPIVLPTDEKVVEKAMETVFKERRLEVAEEHGITEESEIKRISPESVDINIDQPVYLIHEFTNELTRYRPKLVEEIKARDGDENTNPMTDGQEPIIPYILKEKVGQSINVTVFGGSRMVIYNLCNKMDYTKDEREFILNASRVAAQKNGLHSHVLIDDVAFAPYKVYETPAERSRARNL